MSGVSGVSAVGVQTLDALYTPVHRKSRGTEADGEDETASLIKAGYIAGHRRGFGEIGDHFSQDRKQFHNRFC